ncbi:polyphosphate kinase 2 [Methylophaga thiooxydans]|uniref:polyphosphate kinase 2 n=1 Tax=Methylophaga thiooxydans TaxID=392484 RepID=UPI002357828E|nr:polyphosphate kinase 2 [Methylophaga thiooxydans]
MAKTRKLSRKDYEKQLAQLQIELLKVQEWTKETGQRILILFEGRDASGKGGTIKRFIEHLNPRGTRVVALEKPSDTEQTQWYFQRYLDHLPNGGEIVLFDRSWYNRAGVEKVMGFTTEDKYQLFLRQVPALEQMLIDDGIWLFKYWFSISREEQKDRFVDRLQNPLKHWKLSPIDISAQEKWDDYSAARDAMFATTHTNHSPWTVVKSDNKKAARINCISDFLRALPYSDKNSELVENVDENVVFSPAYPALKRRAADKK